MQLLKTRRTGKHLIPDKRQPMAFQQKYNKLT